MYFGKGKKRTHHSDFHWYLENSIIGHIHKCIEYTIHKYIEISKISRDVSRINLSRLEGGREGEILVVSPSLNMFLANSSY